MRQIYRTYFSHLLCQHANRVQGRQSGHQNEKLLWAIHSQISGFIAEHVWLHFVFYIALDMC